MNDATCSGGGEKLVNYKRIEKIIREAWYDEITPETVLSILQELVDLLKEQTGP